MTNPIQNIFPKGPKNPQNIRLAKKIKAKLEDYLISRITIKLQDSRQIVLAKRQTFGIYHTKSPEI